VHLHPDDFKHQQIFWRSDPNEPLKSFSLTTLTYGLKPSSFIATRCLQELSNQNNKSFPKESEIIRKHLYMDDLLTGSNTASQLIDIKIVIYGPSGRRHFSHMSALFEAGASASFARMRRIRLRASRFVQYFLKRTLEFLNYYPKVSNLVNRRRLPKCQSN
jgi:hypothetical protein